MSSFSSSELSRPHIGSRGGGGVFFAGMPESQWPAALPTQQAIAFALSEEALEIGTKIAKNDNATAIATSFAVKILINLIRLRRLFFGNRLANQFHFALSANAA